jgi:hypothetical protein
MRRYAFAWAYLALFVLTQVCWTLLDAAGRASFVAWASTSVANLKTDPIGCLIVSAFVTDSPSWAWPVLIGAALFAACHVAGSRRTLVVCVAGHVVGTLVSEGIEAYRVDAGQLPPADNHLTDVGPSYVVVAAIVLTLIWPSLVPRIVVAADLALLVFVGDIFGGLTSLDVAAVGHLASMVTATVSGYVAYTKADRVRDRRRAGAETDLPERATPERPAR